MKAKIKFLPIVLTFSLLFSSCGGSNASGVDFDYDIHKGAEKSQLMELLSSATLANCTLKVVIFDENNYLDSGLARGDILPIAYEEIDATNAPHAEEYLKSICGVTYEVDEDGFVFSEAVYDRVYLFTEDWYMCCTTNNCGSVYYQGQTTTYKTCTHAGKEVDVYGILLKWYEEASGITPKSWRDKT